MKSWIGYLAELQEMKEKMHRVWNTLLEESPIAKEQEIWQWVEKFQKFEGTFCDRSETYGNQPALFVLVHSLI